MSTHREVEALDRIEAFLQPSLSWWPSGGSVTVKIANASGRTMGVGFQVLPKSRQSFRPHHAEHWAQVAPNAPANRTLIFSTSAGELE